jgi:hypothetical protein
MYYLGKVAEVKASRGFESPSLRPYKNHLWVVFYWAEREESMGCFLWGFEDLAYHFVRNETKW